jgi:hypothetical protein
MIGRFTTVKFDSRAAFERGDVAETLVSHNRFTNVGLKWMWDMMAGQLRDADGTLNDHLGSARIVVGDGSSPFDLRDERLAGENTAQASLDAGYPTVNLQAPGDDGRGHSVISFLATFGEDQAAFDWQERGVVTAQGVLLDRAVQDQGRKVLGAVWQLKADLFLDS